MIGLKCDCVAKSFQNVLSSSRLPFVAFVKSSADFMENCGGGCRLSQAGSGESCKCVDF